MVSHVGAKTFLPSTCMTEFGAIRAHGKCGQMFFSVELVQRQAQLKSQLGGSDVEDRHVTLAASLANSLVGKTTFPMAPN